jgi:hypothetical protein
MLFMWGIFVLIWSCCGVSGVSTLRGGVAVKLSCGGFLLVVVTWQLLFELVQSCSVFFGVVVVVVVLTGCLSIQRLVWSVIIFFVAILLLLLFL